MYMYNFKAILKTPMKNGSDKDMIWDFKKLTTDLKNAWIQSRFTYNGQQSIKSIKNTTTTMGIKYKLVPTSNNRYNNVEISIHTF